MGYSSTPSHNSNKIVQLRIARKTTIGRLRLGSRSYLYVELFLDGAHVVVEERLVLGQTEQMLEGRILMGGAVGQLH
jgi:hypothetical protein